LTTQFSRSYYYLCSVNQCPKGTGRDESRNFRKWGQDRLS